MTTSIVVFTRDLRVNDNPALRAAIDSAEEIVPVWVLDRGIRGTDFNRPNRAKFLAECLADLDQSLKDRGVRLIIRHGDVAKQVADLAKEVDAGTVHMARDWSKYGVARQVAIDDRLDERRELHLHDSHVVIPPGAAKPSGGDYFSVFTPYHRKWLETSRRNIASTPRSIRMPMGVASERIPIQDDICKGKTSPDLLEGGESRARDRANDFYRSALKDYEDDHDAMARDNTSRLSSYLHFGCISPLELVAKAHGRGPGADAFARQLCWRDFYHQVLATRPALTHEDYRSQGDRWRHDKGDFARWVEGSTGYPIVDAGMRQLQNEGWMHNRARLLVGSFLTKHLYVDWRWGARHFFDLLIDGDIVNNTMNWQWIAGTGTDSRPNRMLNPTIQAHRYDANGDYVRRYVDELKDIEGGAVHEPWKLAEPPKDYPRPMVDHSEAVGAFRAHRGKG